MKPFNDFFINCYTNSLLTFVLEKEPSYLIASYLNEYSYFLDDLKGRSFPFLFGDYTKQFYDNFSSVAYMENHVYDEAEKQSDTDELIGHILTGEKVIIYVDLYYWTDKIGRSYNMPNQIHMKHAITLVDYDEENERFTYFDMDNSFHFNAYKMNKQEMTEVLDSTRQYEVESKVKISEANYSVIRLREHTEEYVFDCNTVQKNAVRLCEQLNNYKEQTLNSNELVEVIKSNASLMYIKCTIFGNIHRGNIRLFEYLQKQNVLTNVQAKELCETEESMIYTNNLILTGIMMCESRGNWSKINDYANSRYELINLEISIWNKYLKYVGENEHEKG